VAKKRARWRCFVDAQIFCVTYYQSPKIGRSAQVTESLKTRYLLNFLPEPDESFRTTSSLPLSRGKLRCSVISIGGSLNDNHCTVLKPQDKLQCCRLKSFEAQWELYVPPVSTISNCAFHIYGSCYDSQCKQRLFT
jgi:hypothetical protein